MAIDSEAKRASALSASTPDLLPIPDGTVDQGDRQTTIGMYRGILAGVAIAVKNVVSRIAIRIGINL